MLANPALIKMFEYSDLDEFLKVPVSQTYWDPKERQVLMDEFAKKNQVNSKVFKFRKKNGQCLNHAICYIFINSLNKAQTNLL